MSVGEGPPRGTLGTVHNAAVLLGLLATGPTHHQLTDLAERSGMSLATVHRLLRSLVAAGLVEQDDETSRYGLGPEVVWLAERYLRRHPLAEIGAPYLVELRNATGCTVVVSVLAGDHLVLLDRIDGRDAGGVYRDPRRVQDPTRSAAGRLLLAHGDDARWQRTTGAAGIAEAERDDWRARDLLVHRPASPAEQADVAAPVRDRAGGVVAAVAVTGLAAEAAERLEQRIGPLVVRAADAVGRALGAP